MNTASITQTIANERGGYKFMFSLETVTFYGKKALKLIT